MISLTIGLALAVSIAIGRVRKINIGLVAIPFAYIIGAFFMHIKPSDVIDLSQGDRRAGWHLLLGGDPHR